MLPGVQIGGGFGVTPDLPTLIPRPTKARLQPDISYPQAAKQAPPGGVGVFITIDLAKTPLIGPVLAPILGDVTRDRPK